MRHSATSDAEPPGPRPLLRAGLVGRAIQQSRTPMMHEAEGARLGLRYEYGLLDFDRLQLADSDLPQIIARARNEDYAGLNVTHPFKESVIANLDGLSKTATAIGAVNTVVFTKGKSIGHNTDYWGFVESFRRGLEGAPLHDVVLIGAGGAGMAVSRALMDSNTKRLSIFDVESEKAARLVASLQAHYGAERVVEVTDIEKSIAQSDGLVNATPVGMEKYPGTPVPAQWLRPDLWVADIVYFPPETELLKAAKTVGCRTLSGTGMAIFQAVKAFELITGVTPDPEQMAKHFRLAEPL